MIGVGNAEPDQARAIEPDAARSRSRLLREDAPDENAPGEEAPGEDAPGEDAPGEDAPGDKGGGEEEGRTTRSPRASNTMIPGTSRSVPP